MEAGSMCTSRIRPFKRIQSICMYIYYGNGLIREEEEVCAILPSSINHSQTSLASHRNGNSSAENDADKNRTQREPSGLGTNTTESGKCHVTAAAAACTIAVAVTVTAGVGVIVGVHETELDARNRGHNVLRLVSDNIEL